MNSNNQKSTADSLSNEFLVNGVPVDQLVSDIVDPRRVFILYAEHPGSLEAKTRAGNLKKAWEKLYGVDTCEVIILSSEERVESLV